MTLASSITSHLRAFGHHPPAVSWAPSGTGLLCVPAGSRCSSTKCLSFFRRTIDQAEHTTCSTAHPTVLLIGLLVQKEQSMVLGWERFSVDQSSLILQHFVPSPPDDEDQPAFPD